MRLRWLGHSCFLIDDAVVTDPYHEGLGFSMPAVEAKVVTLSHDHFDHNNAQAVGGHPIVLQGDVVRTIGGIGFRSIATYHDPENGRLRGQNRVFVITTQHGVVCHMGDIGEACTPDLCRRIGKVDVLLIPIGGHYTIDAAQAKAYVDALCPRWVVPMHYRTEECTLDIATADDFIESFAPHSVVSVSGDVADLSTEAGPVQVLLFA